MSEVSDLVRYVPVSMAKGGEITISVRPGERTRIRPEDAEYWRDVLDARPWPLEQGHLLKRGVPVGFRPDSALHVLPVEFTTEAKENTLRADYWKKFFPFDYEARREDFVPLLGEIWRKKLVADGVLSGRESIVGIDVETENHRVFEDMLDALHWAESLRKPPTKPAVFFYRYMPHFWPFLKEVPSESWPSGRSRY